MVTLPGKFSAAAVGDVIFLVRVQRRHVCFMWTNPVCGPGPPFSFSPRGTVGPNPFLFFTPISATYPLDGGYKAWASWTKIRPYRWNALSRRNTSSALFDGFYVGGPNVFFGKQRGIKMCQSAGLKHKSARRLSSFYVSRHGED